jgi:hypothetical protein
MIKICDPRHGMGKVRAGALSGGPYAAGKGSLVTDGCSAFFLAEEPAPGLPPLPAKMTRALRPLLTRSKGGIDVRLLDLTAWLAANFPGCGGCVEGLVACDHPRAEGKDHCPDCGDDEEMACACTTHCARIVDVPVYGWHLRRQLDAIAHRPERVRLARLVDYNGDAVLQVSCPAWTFVRMAVREGIRADLAPVFPGGAR